MDKKIRIEKRSSKNAGNMYVHVPGVFCSFAIENEEEFIRCLEVLSDFQVETAIKENKKAFSTAERRVKELDELIRKLYEGNATEKKKSKAS